MSENEKTKRSPIKAGWISLLLGLVFCFLWGLTGGFFSIGFPDLVTMASIMLALPLLLASFILSIVGMCKGQAFGGIALMVGTLIFPSIVVLAGTVASTLTTP